MPCHFETLLASLGRWRCNALARYKMQALAFILLKREPLFPLKNHPYPSGGKLKTFSPTNFLRREWGGGRARRRIWDPGGDSSSQLSSAREGPSSATSRKLPYAARLQVSTGERGPRPTKSGPSVLPATVRNKLFLSRTGERGPRPAKAGPYYSPSYCSKSPIALQPFSLLREIARHIPSLFHTK